MAPHSSILAWKIPWMEEPGMKLCPFLAHPEWGTANASRGKHWVKRQPEAEGREAGWEVGWEQPALVGNACHSSICAHTAGIFHPPGKGN